MDISKVLEGYKLPELILPRGNSDSLEPSKKKQEKDPEDNPNYWIQKCADLTEMKFMVMFGKTKHLNNKQTYHWIKELYLDSLDADGIEKKRKKFWWLLGKTKVDITKTK